MILSETYKVEIKKTISLAIPIVIAQLGVVMMGVTDNILVGRLLGTTALGAAGIANAIAFLVASIAVGGLSVVAPLISKAKAEQRPDEVNRLFRAGIKAAIWFSITLTGLGAAVVVNFNYLRQTPEVDELASNYLFILLFANVLLILFLAVKQFPDGLSRTKVAMGITIIGLIANFILNFVLIQGKWGFPKMGINGSAMATLLTRLLMLAAMLFYLYWDKNFAPYLKKTYSALKTKDLTLHIFTLGIPAGLQLFFEIAAFTVAVIMMGWLGEDRLAAHQIVINVASITYMMASGLAFSGAIRVGEGRGLRDLQQIRISGMVAFGLSAVFMSLCMVLLVGLDRYWISLYVDDPQVMAIGVKLMLVAAVFQLSDGFQVVAAGVLRGLSDVNVPTLITLLAYWGIALPLGYWLAFHMGMDAVGVWVGLWAGLTVAAVLQTRRFFVLVKKQEIEESKN